MTIPLPVRSCIVTYLGEGRGLHYSLGVSAGERLIAQPIGTSLDLFTADQLRAYGEAVRAEERAAILDIAMRRSLLSDNLDQLRGYECCKEGIIASIKERAAAIRAAAPPQCTDQPSEPQ